MKDKEARLIWETFTDGSPANNPGLAAGGMRNEDEIETKEELGNKLVSILIKKLDNGHHPTVEYEEEDGTVKQATVNDYDEWDTGVPVFFGNSPDGEEVQLQAHHIVNILS